MLMGSMSPTRCRKQDWISNQRRNWCEIVQNIIGKRIVGAIEHMGPEETEADRIAVGPRTRNPTRADAPVPPADVFDDDVLPKRFCHAQGNHPCKRVGSPSRRERNDQRDWPRWVGLRSSNARDTSCSAAAPAVRRSKLRREDFMWCPPSRD